MRGTVAELISPVGQGIQTISTLLNVTRLYNSIAATGLISRALATARQYSISRVVFNKSLQNKPLHLETLSTLTVEYAACVQLTMHAVQLLGREEAGQATSNDKQLLRLLTPLVKLYTAKASVHIISEALECCGGIGYMEGSGLPRCLRDAQVLPVWEGCTNVLSLDMLRAAKNGSVEILVNSAKHRLNSTRSSNSKLCPQHLLPKITNVLDTCNKHLSSNPSESIARDIALQLTRAYASTLLCAQASWSGLRRDWAVFKLFCEGGQETWGNNRWLSGDVIRAKTEYHNHYDPAPLQSIVYPDWPARL